MPPRWTATPSWKRVRPPGFIDPCIPALVDFVPAGPDWLHELKWDGYRIIARKEGGSVKLWSRAGRGWHLASFGPFKRRRVAAHCNGRRARSGGPLWQSRQGPDTPSGGR